MAKSKDTKKAPKAKTSGKKLLATKGAKKATAKKSPAKKAAKTPAVASRITIDRLDVTTMGLGIGVADFLDTTGFLSKAERLLLVDQAIAMLEGTYVHLPLKEAMHAVDPLQRLRLLRHRTEQTAEEKLPSEFDFHSEMLGIFTSVRDLHTNYLLPDPFNRMVAVLPFQVEEYFDGESKYMVTNVAEGIDHPTFRVGVEVTHWNAVPIDRAVALSAEKHAGSNPPARHSRGVAGLTVRPLRLALPPDAEWVNVGYRTPDGTDLEIRVPWRVRQPGAGISGATPEAFSLNATVQALDIEADIVRQTTKELFAPQVMEAQKKVDMAKAKKAAVAGALATGFPDIFWAQNLETAHGTVGYIRVRSFNVDSHEAFVDDFVHLIEQLSPDGLIIDMRDNGGGHIFAAERLLQLFTPHRVEPEPTQFINTPVTARLTALHAPSPLFRDFDLKPWRDSIAQAIETGATYSRAFPITPPDLANDIGQRYHGPVVLITNARCYSACDIFAAGFQDHRLGLIIGVDNNTGAGGANVFEHRHLEALFLDPETNFSKPLSDSPFRQLPSGAAMRVSFRRMLRIGTQAGTPLEDLGVTPDRRHDMTRDDILHGNRDLIDAAAKLLAELPGFRLRPVNIAKDGDGLKLTIAVKGFDRLDAYADGRPLGSIDVTDGDAEMTTASGANAATIELKGYRQGVLVAARRLSI